jgi:transposase
MDGSGGKLGLPRLFACSKRNLHHRWCRLKSIWADGAYEGLVPYVHKPFGRAREVVRRPPDAKGFTGLPRRGVVERAFGWLGRYRRLGRDFEHPVSSSEAMAYLASIRRTRKVVTTENAN